MLDNDLVCVVTDNVTVRAIEHYAFNRSNWRAVFDFQGTTIGGTPIDLELIEDIK